MEKVQSTKAKMKNNLSTISILTTLIVANIETMFVYSHATIPSRYPPLIHNMMSGDLLLEPMIKRAIEYIKKSVDSDILNIPVSIYNSAIPNEPEYKGNASENYYNTIRRVKTKNVPNDIYTCRERGWGMSYDDGPSEDTPRLLDELKIKNIKSTFFIIGTSGIQNVDIIKRMDLEGHEIGIHTWNHYPMTLLTNEQIVAEIKYSESLVYAITGRVTKSLRPPYGNIDDRVRAIAWALGYNIIMWDADSKDTYDTPENVAKTLLELSRETKGFISLQHDYIKTTVDYAINLLKQLSPDSRCRMQDPKVKCLEGPIPIGDCNSLSEWYWKTDGSIPITSRYNFTEYLEQENSFRTRAGLGNGNIYTDTKRGVYSGVGGISVGVTIQMLFIATLTFMCF